MKINYLPSNGFVLNSIVWILAKLSCPMDCLHNFLKKLFVQSFFKKLDKSDSEGYYIESWAIFWAIMNILFFLRFSANPNISKTLYSIVAIIILLRAADLLKVLFVTSFSLNNEPQRSLPRSFILLTFAFFELGAIFTSVQFIICRICEKDCISGWGLAYYYSLRNMVTIGGGVFEIQCSFSLASKLFYIIRIFQPLLSILLVSFAINNIFKKK